MSHAKARDFPRPEYTDWPPDLRFRHPQGRSTADSVQGDPALRVLLAR